jgi:hypothetical protein
VERRVDTLRRHPESLEVNHEPRANHGTDHWCGDRSLPNVQDCYDRANLCMEMWNGSGGETALSGLLRMADAWLQLADELGKRL